MKTTKSRSERPAWKILACEVAEFFRKNPKAWAQGAMALNAKGKNVDPKSKAAVCWCLRGKAFAIAVNSMDYVNFVHATNEAAGMFSASWNDEPKRTVKQVITLLEKLAA
jgi:hypothetical protein